MDKSKMKIMIDMVPFAMGILIVFGASIHAGLRDGLKSGLIAFGVFGAIVAVLLFVETNTKRKGVKP